MQELTTKLKSLYINRINNLMIRYQKVPLGRSILSINSLHICMYSFGYANAIVRLPLPLLTTIVISMPHWQRRQCQMQHHAHTFSRWENCLSAHMCVYVWLKPVLVRIHRMCCCILQMNFILILLQQCELVQTPTTCNLVICSSY